MCPSEIILNTSLTLQYSGQNIPANLSKQITKPTTLNGYTPKNNKLLTFPYCALVVSNNSGSSNQYHYELFNEVDEYPNQCLFNIKGVPVVGASIKLNPINYKNSDETQNELEGLMCGKFPTLSWSEDAYINWLTANSVNIGVGVSSELLEFMGGAETYQNADFITQAGLGLFRKMETVYQHSLTPNSAKGNTNGGDINSCSNSNTFFFYKMSIKEEYARIIDDYFSKYGYAINRIVSPNIVGRQNYNYVEIGASEQIGYGDVPDNFMQEINNACRKGVTIWHNYENFGNYSVSNSIVE